MTYTHRYLSVKVTYWWVDSMLTPLIARKFLGERVALHVLFSSELSGNKSTSLRYLWPMEP